MTETKNEFEHKFEHICEYGCEREGKYQISIEVDEKFHFGVDGNLLEKDIRRQKEITEFLNCEFIRLRI